MLLVITENIVILHKKTWKSVIKQGKMYWKNVQTRLI